MTIQMTRSAAISPLAPEFEEFLFAPIGEEGNGMLLSVLSALARLDVDPWQEAAKLARLPAAMATDRLASLIAAISEKSPAQQAPEAIAARLVTLLPHPSRPSRSRQREESTRASANLQAAMCMVYAAIFIAFALGPQLILGIHPQDQTGTAQVSTSHTAAAPDAPSPTTPRQFALNHGE